MPCEKQLENHGFSGLPAFRRSALRTVAERRRGRPAPTWCVVWPGSPGASASDHEAWCEQYARWALTISCCAKIAP